MKDWGFDMFDVGQGLCTVLSGMKDNGSPYFAVFDCGTLEQGSSDLSMIVEMIAAISQAYGGINCIVISHQDIDHWSMLMDIIFAVLGAKEKNVLCLEQRLYIERNKTTTIIYDKEPVGDKITYSFFEVFKESETSVEFKIDSQDKVLGFDVILKFEKDCHWGDCTFLLKAKEDGNGELSIKLYNIMGDICINTSYNIDFTSAAGMQDVKTKVNDTVIQNGIYGVFQEDYGLRMRYNAFVTVLDKLCVSYHSMADKLLMESNYNPNMHIGSVWLGGDCWGIGYTRLYYLLRKLVDCRIVADVNGYTRFNKLPEASPRKCGLLCMNTDGPIFGFHADMFAYDEDLEDIKSEKKNWDSLAIQRNATSLVVDFHTAVGFKVLLPGDATVHTFRSLAQKLSGTSNSATLLVAPHHGSDHTNFCHLKEEGDLEQPLVTLLNVLGRCENNKLIGCWVSALAKVYGHPGKRFTDAVCDYLPKSNLHKICFVQDDTKQEINKENNLHCTECDHRISYRSSNSKQSQSQATKKVSAGIRPPINKFLKTIR